MSDKKRILVVDDEETIRHMVSRILISLGHEVTGCSSVTDALASMQYAGENFDLIVSDIGMPGMDGLTFARSVRELKPGQLIILMSGDHGRQLRQASNEGITTITKPFERMELVNLVEKVLVA